MSANYFFEGIPLPPKTTAVTTGGVDITATVGVALHRVVKIRITNVDTANSARCSLFWNDGASSQFWQETVAADSTREIDDPLVFTSEGVSGGYPLKLTATASADNRIRVTVYSVTSPPFGA